MRPFYAWVEVTYPGEALRDKRWNVEQRVEHFFISITVDMIVVTLLLRLVGRQQQKLAESEELYRALFEHANDGIGVVAAASYKVVDANNKFCEILDCRWEVIRGRDIRGLLRVANDDGASPTRSGLLDGIAVEESELLIQTPANNALPISISFYPLATSQERLIILIIRDLFTRKRLEAEKEEMQHQLFQSSKLASLGELSAGVAHEINNPLNGIINFAQLLKDEEVTRTHFQGQMLEGIIEEGARIAQIVRSLLTFARHDAHEIGLIRIAELIKTSIALFGRQFEKDGISVEIEMAESLPLINGDASRLRQVVVNMMSNAHHALKGQPVDLAAKKVFRIVARPAQRDGDANVRLEFYDNGVGIRREDLAKVFDPFFTTRRDAGGTGLGLSISFGIIRDHGGTISVESETDRFTRFIVELPAAVAESPEKAYV
ncbi:MAG: PAS domain S-box protein [Acidobacteria bacterium]|nr:PAS domain S-box protein [Acidobacteriota bacterium]